MKILNSAVFATSMIALLSSASSYARDINCPKVKEQEKGSRLEKTIDGIRMLNFHKNDSEGNVVLEITQDGRPFKSGPAQISGESSEFSWWDNVSKDPSRGDASMKGVRLYSVDESVSLRKSRDAVKGVSTFSLVKVRRILSGPNCDGYHSCNVQEVVLASVPESCEDSNDTIRATPHTCDLGIPGDCE